MAAVEAERGGKAQEKSAVVSYRVSRAGYRTMIRIAELLFKNGSIKVNTVNALAKAAAFTQMNLFLQIEAREKREKALQDSKLPMREFDQLTTRSMKVKTSSSRHCVSVTIQGCIRNE